MKTLVTGGAGFIGSHVAQHCLAMGHEVIVLDDLSGGFKDQVPAEAHFVRGSITDSDLISELFEQYQFGYVYHLAAYAAEGLSHFIRKFNYTNNLIGSIHLINESVKHHVKCFVFTSSIAVYGRNQLPMVETETPLPEDPYGISKYAIELDLKAAHEMFGLNSIIFRPHNVYGENQNVGDKYRNVIGIFINQMMSGDPMTIFGDGNQTRAFSYIADVAPYIAKSVEIQDAYNQVFNIGADIPYTVNHLAQTIARAFNLKPNINYLDARLEVEHAYADHSKARSIFSIDNLVSLEEGITRMIAWARKKGPRTSSKFKNIEIKQNLPPSWR